MVRGGGSGSANIFLTTQTPPYSGGGLWIKTNLTKYSFNNSIQPGLTATLLQFPHGYTFGYSNFESQLWQYDDNNVMAIEMGAIRAPSTSQAASYPRAVFTTYNIPAQTTTVWTYKYVDDEGDTRTGTRMINADNDPWVFSSTSSGPSFEIRYHVTSGNRYYYRYVVNIPGQTFLATTITDRGNYYAYAYFQEGNVNYFMSTNYLSMYNTNTFTSTRTTTYGSVTNRQAIIKSGNNIYCVGCGSDNCVYSLTTYTWTALPSYGSIGAGSGYVFRDNICYFRNNNQIIAFNLNTNTFTVTNTIDAPIGTTQKFMGWANWQNNYLLAPQYSYNVNNGIYRFSVAGTAGNSDTVYIVTGGNKNYANIVSGQSGAASVPIQGVYTVVNGVLTPYTEAYVSTGGAWARISY